MNHTSCTGKRACGLRARRSRRSLWSGRRPVYFPASCTDKQRKRARGKLHRLHPVHVFDHQFAAVVLGGVAEEKSRGKIRPHAVRRSDVGADGALAFEADVASALFLGEFVRYELQVGESRLLADVPHERFAQPIAPGTRAAFHVPASELFALPA